MSEKIKVNKVSESLEGAPVSETKPLEVVEAVASRIEPGLGQVAGAGAVEKTWDNVIRWLLYALSFFLPILFTPWTTEPLEFSKLMLLFVLTVAAIIAWLLKLLILRSWHFVKTPLDLPILIFLIVYLLASIFSVDRVASFMGFFGTFSGNFFQVLFLAAFYYLVVNNFSTFKEVKRLIAIFLFSVFLATLYMVLQFFGWFVIPVSVAKVPNFNTVGGLLIISLFSAFAIILALGYKTKSWFGVFGGRTWRIITIVCGFLVLLTVNFVYAWAGLLVGLLVYMILQTGFTKTFSMKNFLAPLVLLIIVAAFLISQWVFQSVPFRNLFNFNLPVEVRLDYATAKEVLRGSVVNRPVLGSGPNTFSYAFSKFRDQNFNASPFWNVRFDKAPSEAAEYLVGTGILGVLAFELLNLVFLIYGLFFLFRRRDPESWNLALALFSAYAVLWFAHWFFFFNTVMAFSFWLMIAAFMAVVRVTGGERIKTTSFSFATSPRRTVSVVSLVSVSLVLMIVFLFFSSAVYASDIFYRKGLQASAQTETYDDAQRDFAQAIRLNRFRPDYYLTYGEFLFLRINQELVKQDRDPNLIQTWLQTGINTSRMAVVLSPVNWTAWERLANLYTIARPLVAGVDKFIIESLQEAIKTDPHNPILHTELGQVYRLAARRLDPTILGKGVDSDSDGLSDEQEGILGSNPDDPDSNGNNVLDGNEVLAGLNPAGTGALPDSFLAQYLKTDPESLIKSAESFRKAIALKNDYILAYYHLALVLEQQGKAGEAAAELEKALQYYPRDLTLKFELGRIYFNSGKVEEAAKQFKEITLLMPTHANARFSLALSYERLGNLKKALIEYQKVYETNQENEALKTKIQELEQALIVPAPTPTPTP